MRKLPFLAILTALAWGGATAAGAASFDCKQAASPMEHLVCGDPKLSALDDQLAKTFAAALAISLDPAGLRSDEKQWLGQVRNTASATDTSTQYYSVRLGVLAKVLADQPQRRRPCAISAKPPPAAAPA